PIRRLKTTCAPMTPSTPPAPVFTSRSNGGEHGTILPPSSKRVRDISLLPPVTFKVIEGIQGKRTALEGACFTEDVRTAAFNQCHHRLRSEQCVENRLLDRPCASMRDARECHLNSTAATRAGAT